MYSKLEPGVNFWTSGCMLSLSNLVKKIASLYNMNCRESVVKAVESPFNGRQIDVPVFSFIDQAVSLLSSAGTRGEHFWDPATIDVSNTTAAPSPVDLKRKVSEIHSSYLFQSAVSRFCSKPNHDPPPIIIGYDKANLSRQGYLAITPLVFTFGFFKSHWWHKLSFWRIFGDVPNLFIGVDKNLTTDEHYII